MNWRNKVAGFHQIRRFDNGLRLLLTRLFFPAETLNVYRYKNLEFLEDHAAGDANGAREVLTTEMYRQFLPLIKFAAPLDILDLGANNGGFSLLLKSENLPLAKIVCVELNPQTFSRLRFNLERNFGGEAECFNCAVCAERQEIAFVPSGGSASDSIYQKRTGEAEPFTIQGLTFDEIFSRSFNGQTIDVCKMDIEGAEFEIFAGDNCRHLADCRYLIIEIHHDSQNRRGSIIEKLSRLNFREIDGENKTADERHYVHFFINSNLIC